MARKAAPSKRARRKPGTGTIRRKAGRAQPWEAGYKYADGRWRYTYHDSLEAAEQALDALVAAAKSGRDLVGGAQPLSDYLHTWLEYRRGRVATSTLNRYTEQLAYCTAIKDIRLDKLLPADVERMLRGLQRDGLGNTIAAVHQVLKAALRQAVEWEYITRNPAAQIAPLPVERRKGIALSVAQRAALLAAAPADDAAWIASPPTNQYPRTLWLEALWHLYSRLGLRRGEGLALQWGDVNWDAKTLTIARSLSREGTTMQLGKTKTKKTRVVALPDDVVELLSAHRARQVAYAASVAAWRVTGFIFTDAAGGPLNADQVRYRWHVLKQRVGIDQAVRLHDLRHTALTILEQQGAPLSVRMALAGHTTAEMAAHYADHATIESMRRALG